MSERTDVVAELYAAFARGDEARALELIDPRFEIRQTDELPWGGAYEGVDGFREFARRLFASVDSRVTVEELFEAGANVVALGRTAGTTRANATPFDVRIAHVWTVENGRATRFHPYIDTPAMKRALESAQ